MERLALNMLFDVSDARLLSLSLSLMFSSYKRRVCFIQQTH